jgi:hypothetical protein
MTIGDLRAWMEPLDDELEVIAVQKGEHAYLQTIQPQPEQPQPDQIDADSSSEMVRSMPDGTPRILPQAAPYSGPQARCNEARL